MSNSYQVLDPGHAYKLSNGETVTFIKRSQGQLVHAGIQNEELFELLIDRLNYLQTVLPCLENKVSLFNLETALEAQILRASRRIAQRVETTDIPHV